MVTPGQRFVSAFHIAKNRGCCQLRGSATANDLASEAMTCKVNPMKIASDLILTRRGFLAASLIVSDLLFNRTAGGLDAV
ncbi:MAG TPA: hypothetical protein VF130_04535, partial [Candidatus Binatia bacterium]